MVRLLSELSSACILLASYEKLYSNQQWRYQRATCRHGPLHPLSVVQGQLRLVTSEHHARLVCPRLQPLSLSTRLPPLCRAHPASCAVFEKGPEHHYFVACQCQHEDCLPRSALRRAACTLWRRSYRNTVRAMMDGSSSCHLHFLERPLFELPSRTRSHRFARSPMPRPCQAAALALQPTLVSSSQPVSHRPVPSLGPIACRSMSLTGHYTTRTPSHSRGERRSISPSGRGIH